MEKYEVFAEMGTRKLEGEELKDLLRKQADESENLENLIFEYGLDCIANNRVKINCLNNLRGIVDHLNDEWTAFVDLCGEEDEINTLPTQKLFFEAAGILFLLETEWGFRSKDSIEDEESCE